MTPKKLITAKVWLQSCNHLSWTKIKVWDVELMLPDPQTEVDALQFPLFTWKSNSIYKENGGALIEEAGGMWQKLEFVVARVNLSCPLAGLLPLRMVTFNKIRWYNQWVFNGFLPWSDAQQKRGEKPPLKSDVRGVPVTSKTGRTNLIPLFFLEVSAAY